MALERYLRSLEIYEKIKDSLGVSSVRAEIAELHVAAGKHAEAFAEIGVALQFGIASENKYAIAKCIALLRKLGRDPEEFLNEVLKASARGPR